ncbi:MAG TPA: DUF4124 domain-containing protein [Methylotenera sp.]|nr:DUF4124 domain-containing protein [Methylotenera sp.]
MTQSLTTNIYKYKTKGRLVSFYSLILLLLMTFAQHIHAEEAKRIVKWKDDKGVTHYGDSIPAQYSNRENSLINKQGITVKRNKPISYEDESLSLAKIEQDKKDKALLSAFTNESEIDLARDRNLQLDQVTLEGLQLQKTNSQKRLAESQKYANSFMKNKKPIPADLATDIKTNQAEISKIDKQIADRKAAMYATRKRFDDDKKRYILLRSPANGSAAPTEVPLTTKP